MVTQVAEDAFRARKRPESPPGRKGRTAPPNNPNLLDLHPGSPKVSRMDSLSPPASRRAFLKASALAGLGLLGVTRGLVGQTSAFLRVGLGDPEVPNDQVAKILKDLF